MQSAEHAETPVTDHGSAVCFACITGGSAASIGCRQLFTMYSSKISCSALHTTGEPIDPVDGMPWALRMAAHRLRRAAYRSTQQWERDWKSRRQTQERAPAVRHRSVTTPFLRLPTYISRMRRSSFGAPFCSERSDPIVRSKAVQCQPKPRWLATPTLYTARRRATAFKQPILCANDR